MIYLEEAIIIVHCNKLKCSLLLLVDLTVLLKINQICLSRFSLHGLNFLKSTREYKIRYTVSTFSSIIQ